MLPESELGNKVAKLSPAKAPRKQVDIKLPYKTETQDNLVYKLIDQNITADPPQKNPNREPSTCFQMQQSNALQFNGIRIQVFAA